MRPAWGGPNCLDAWGGEGGRGGTRGVEAAAAAAARWFCSPAAAAICHWLSSPGGREDRGLAAVWARLVVAGLEVVTGGGGGTADCGPCVRGKYFYTIEVGPKTLIFGSVIF